MLSKSSNFILSGVKDTLLPRHLELSWESQHILRSIFRMDHSAAVHLGPVVATPSCFYVLELVSN